MVLLASLPQHILTDELGTIRTNKLLQLQDYGRGAAPTRADSFRIGYFTGQEAID